MCDVCGSVHNDLRRVEGTTLRVCLSARHCLVAALLRASEAEISRLHNVAIQSALPQTAPGPLKTRKMGIDTHILQQA